jgi:hypothetical protein
MKHITCCHAGELIDEPLRQLLVAVERVTCTDVHCGGFRRMGSRNCNRCDQATTVRPPQIGDTIMGPASTIPGHNVRDHDEGSAAAARDTGEGASSTRIDALILPGDFSARVQGLSPHTMVHIPKSSRKRILDITAKLWHGMALGSDTHALAEEGRSKLLLSSIPQGGSAADEVSARLSLWEQGNFESLVQRIEQQRIVMNKSKGRTKQHFSSDAQHKRAQRMASEGAYRKATASLVSDMMVFDAGEESTWVQQLLPVSSDRAAALCQRDEPSAATALSEEPQPAPLNYDDSPLKGVRYSSLTAPGNSGTRAEHISDMLSVRGRIHANRLLKSLTMLHSAIDQKALPRSARWITSTRLCWQRKKNRAPRPIKMGEFIRSSYAKHLVHKNRAKLRTTLIGMHQWGIGTPGSCEALVHWRSTLEELILAGKLEPMVVPDLDMVNMFGTVEWPSIRDALSEHFSEASPWTAWQHEEPCVTKLPSGATRTTDLGAEQGDVFGSLQSAFALGNGRRSHFAASSETTDFYQGACDQWYVDDGQAFVNPALFDTWLRAVDRGIASFGATRGTKAEGNVKSSCRLVCPPSRRHEFSGWDTPYVHETTHVLDPDGPASALGVSFGGVQYVNADVQQSVNKCMDLRAAITEIDHTLTELVLTRQCSDVSKLTYHLRTNGDRIDDGILATFDRHLRYSIEHTLGGELSDTSWWQATTGVLFGGLGLRTARSTAHAAFVASRIASRPLVKTMVGHFCESIGGDVDSIMLAYDQRTEDATMELMGQLPTESGLELTSELENAACEADLAWREIREPDAAITNGGRRATRITPNDGDADPEHPTSAACHGSLGIQQKDHATRRHLLTGNAA